MNILIQNILAVLPGYDVQTTDLYIQGDTIAAVGECPAGFKADTVIDGSGKLATPGFVNAHTHAYMTLMRNWADDLDFNTWLFQRIMPMEDRLTPADAYSSTLLGLMEMIRSGTTCFLDMHMFPETIVKAAGDIGMRAVISRGLSGDLDEESGGPRRLREAVAEYEKYCGTELVHFMLAPHAPYTCSEAYLRRVAEVAGELDLGIHTHLAESESEIQNVLENHGCTPVEYFDRCGLLTERTVAAHCVQVTENDMDILADCGVSVAVNASSNLKLGNGIAPADTMMEHGVRLCLGTDSAASNNGLSILREMNLVSLLNSGITARQTLQMATENGAAALGLDRQVGKLAPGMKADIAIFDLNQPCMTPVCDVASALCYAGTGLNADTVLINGKIVLKNGIFTTVDQNAVLAEVNAACKRLGMF